MKFPNLLPYHSPPLCWQPKWLFTWRAQHFLKKHISITFSWQSLLQVQAHSFSLYPVWTQISCLELQNRWTMTSSSLGQWNSTNFCPQFEWFILNSLTFPWLKKKIKLIFYVSAEGKRDINLPVKVMPQQMAWIPAPLLPPEIFGNSFKRLPELEAFPGAEMIKCCGSVSCHREANNCISTNTINN